MNAAAKMIHRTSLFQGHWANLTLSTPVFVKSTLVFLMLCSALGVIYMTYSTRTVCSQLELAEENAHQLRVEQGQLLLEQASLLNPERLERTARQSLHMVLPLPQHVYLLQSK